MAWTQEHDLHHESWSHGHALALWEVGTFEEATSSTPWIMVFTTARGVSREP